MYTYDTLNRLTKAETTSAAWGEAYTYDGFGNLTAKTATKGTAQTMSATYDPATNHQTGTTYDANGNPGYNGTFPYDVENHLLQPLNGGTGPQWTYDPSGKRVYAYTPGNGTTVATTCEIYFYGLTGKKLVTFQCGYNDQTGGNGVFWYQVESRNLYFGGKLMRSAGVTVVTDRLGSVRANSNGERMSYFPYGEERTSTTDGREKFGTYFRDPAANGGLDYADQRYYVRVGGGFLTPDPGGIKTADPKNPTSWNRYLYGLGNPINLGDPSGLVACDVAEDEGCYVDPNEWAALCASGDLDYCEEGGNVDDNTTDDNDQNTCDPGAQCVTVSDTAEKAPTNTSQNPTNLAMPTSFKPGYFPKSGNPRGPIPKPTPPSTPRPTPSGPRGPIVDPWENMTKLQKILFILQQGSDAGGGSIFGPIFIIPTPPKCPWSDNSRCLI